MIFISTRCYKQHRSYSFSYLLILCTVCSTERTGLCDTCQRSVENRREWSRGWDKVYLSVWLLVVSASAERSGWVGSAAFHRLQPYQLWGGGTTWIEFNRYRFLSTLSSIIPSKKGQALSKSVSLTLGRHCRFWDTFPVIGSCTIRHGPPPYSSDLSKNSRPDLFFQLLYYFQLLRWGVFLLEHGRKSAGGPLIQDSLR